ncbi:glutamine synthetase family protein [Oceanibaculum indicum]|uniref:Glutamine synthetase n=1 Tax=Oceanibaculum indicum P24 TaxID=1207063 RepID=K2JM00_9PROT|nr:glutamine synthetase [Oceanibaculum indicum]EKE76353.1 glutamine synthetase [Oceanibaculum indicum P24]
MQAREVKTEEEARRIVEARGLSHVKVGVSDIDGVLRGKYMARDKFFSALEGGFGFCDVVLGWDSQDELYDNTRFTGWHTAYPDAPVRILPESCRELPFEDNMLFFLGEFADKAETVCPRGTLRRVLDKAESMGFKARAAFEYEFFLFDETPDSIREKGYYGLKPITPGMFGYSVLRSTVHADFYHALLELSERMDFPIEGLHTETGPGVLEAAITVDDALAAADKAALFKSFTKVLAQRNGMMATFMAKWSPDYPGQSGHLHLSLTDRDGKPVFHDPAAEHGMSPTMRHFLGGQQKLMPEMLALIAPTVNSFSRLIPGYWAPIASLWGVENRTCALRLIGDSPKSKRIEYRVAAADGNPYLVQAAALASGLWGIENEIEPETPIKGNAYEVKPPARLAFPATLWEAAQKLRRSKAARQMLGEDFVEHFAATREWEERQYRKHISDWELQRYFEII